MGEIVATTGWLYKYMFETRFSVTCLRVSLQVEMVVIGVEALNHSFPDGMLTRTMLSILVQQSEAYQ